MHVNKHMDERGLHALHIPVPARIDDSNSHATLIEHAKRDPPIDLLPGAVSDRIGQRSTKKQTVPSHDPCFSRPSAV